MMHGILRYPKWPVPITAIERAWRGLRRYGLAGSICLLAWLVCRWVYLHQRHVWYLLDLSDQRPLIQLPPGLRLVRTGRHNLASLEQVPAVGLSESLRRFDAGGDLWTVCEGSRAVFSCWIFHHRAPVFAARGGWLELPPGTVCLEDSVTVSSHRGRGLAPAAWSAIMLALAQEGVVRIITKVEEQNASCRRAVEKAGFRAVASMSLLRIGLWPQVEVRLQNENDVSAFLVERLAR